MPNHFFAGDQRRPKGLVILRGFHKRLVFVSHQQYLIDGIQLAQITQDFLLIFPKRLLQLPELTFVLVNRFFQIFLLLNASIQHGFLTLFILTFIPQLPLLLNEVTISQGIPLSLGLNEHGMCINSSLVLTLQFGR